MVAGMGMTMDYAAAFFFYLLSLVLAPLLPGVINRVKAFTAGRQGRPLLQLYYDIAKLMQKSPVYSHSTSIFFKAAPVAGVTAGLAGLLMVPFGSVGPLVSFPGDFILLGGLFALSRYALILGALDTGSAFEGMGAAREALFSALAEPIFLFTMLLVGFQAYHYSLGGMLGAVDSSLWLASWPFYLTAVCALFLLLLPENCRIPVDDPNTHLELTMIHEVMILDHSGPDLALLEYASALKLWMFSLLISGLLLPGAGWAFWGPNAAGTPSLSGGLISAALTLLLVFLTAIMVGVVESLMARMRMERVPQILTLAGSFACLAALAMWS